MGKAGYRVTQTAADGYRRTYNKLLYNEALLKNVQSFPFEVYGTTEKCCWKKPCGIKDEGLVSVLSYVYWKNRINAYTPLYPE